MFVAPPLLVPSQFFFWWCNRMRKQLKASASIHPAVAAPTSADVAAAEEGAHELLMSPSLARGRTRAKGDNTARLAALTTLAADAHVMPVSFS